MGATAPLVSHSFRNLILARALALWDALMRNFERDPMPRLAGPSGSAHEMARARESATTGQDGRVPTDAF